MVKDDFVPLINDRVLILSSSGGSGHEQGAQGIQQQLLGEGFPQEYIRKIDVMNSRCTIFPCFGRWSSGLWDHAQKTGNTTRQIILVRGQWLFDRICYFSTYFYVLSLLRDLKHRPNRIVLTSPLFLSAISSAVKTVNKTSKIPILIDLYMTEPPTDKALHFFNPIRGLNQSQRNLLTLHVQKPSDNDLYLAGGEEKYWKEKTGLFPSQIVHDSPIKLLYQRSEVLPLPGQDCELSLKAHPEFEKEGKFFEELASDGLARSYDPSTGECIFSIQKKDKLCLIMLGGVPTKKAILDYVDQILEAAKDGKKSLVESKNYVFISCGDPSTFLYEEVMQKLSRCQSSSVHLIPFTGQPIEKVFARADMTITRSGGMTSLEIMALKKNQMRNDPKKILIHSEAGDAVLDFEEFSARRKTKKHLHDYFEYLIRKGIPLWEGGNAAYLLKEVPSVEIVTVKGVSSYVKNLFFNFPLHAKTSDELERADKKAFTHWKNFFSAKGFKMAVSRGFLIGPAIAGVVTLFFYFRHILIPTCILVAASGLGLYALFAGAKKEKSSAQHWEKEEEPVKLSVMSSSFSE